MNTKRNKLTSENVETTQNDFTVLTYNILADCHVVPCRQQSYHFVQDEHLLKTDGLKSKRHLLTTKELKHFDADILLLQEVEDWYSPLLQSELERSGYEYNYFQKVGVPEGCLLCFRKKKFECLEIVKFFIHDEVRKICRDEGISEDITNELFRPNVALIATLKDTKSGKIIICAVTHIIYNEFRNPAMQCLQACVTCRKINDIRTQLSTSSGINTEEISVIFGGDFNGEPHHMTIQAMKNGKLTNSQLKTLERLSYIVKDRKAVDQKTSDINLVSMYLSGYLQNPLQLSSAYFDIRGMEPNITSSEDTYAGCLDYIFYSSDLKVTSVVDIDSSVEELYVDGGPTEAFGSDHLPLVAHFGY